MAGHDWCQWTPARVGDTPRWRLIRFDETGTDGKPVGRCIESKSPGGGTRTFPTEAAAQRAANWLNEHPEEAPDA